jgi:hypothetical protein
MTFWDKKEGVRPEEEMAQRLRTALEQLADVTRRVVILEQAQILAFARHDELKDLVSATFKHAGMPVINPKK